MRRPFRLLLLVPLWWLWGACGRPAPDTAAVPASVPPPVETGTKDERRAARDQEADRFFAGPILRFEISVGRPEVKSLREDRRQYVPVTVTVGGRRFERVGLHLKGAAGSGRSFDDRPAMTLNFDKFQPDQSCFGLDKLHLNNSVQDDSRLNELVASEMYRRAGVPTARATHALVTLNGEDLGLYVLKEGYDGVFLRRNFPGGKAKAGNLYDGGFLQDVDAELERDAGEGPANREDLQALVKAAEEPVARRRERLEAVLDVDRFLLFLAGQALTDDWDGYGRNRNNYRLYFPSAPGRAVFIPHGMDQLFREPGSSIHPGWSGLIAQQVMEVPEFSERYPQRLAWAATNAFSASQVSNQLQQIVVRLREAYQSRPADEWRQLEGEMKAQQGRIFRRIRSVERQLSPSGSSTSDAAASPGPDDWEPRPRSGHATLDQVTLDGGAKALHFVAHSRGTVASFRSTVGLPAGRYRLTGQARVMGLKGGSGVGLRISGQQRGASLTGDRDWSRLGFEFSLGEDRDVELVVEFSADAGEAWVDCGSLQLTGF